VGYSSLFVPANSLWRLLWVFSDREALLSVVDGRTDGCSHLLDDVVLDINEGIVASA